MGLYYIGSHSTGYGKPHMVFEPGKLYTFRKNKFPSIFVIDDTQISFLADWWEIPTAHGTEVPLLYLGEAFETDRRSSLFFVVPPLYFSFLMGDAKIWIERKEMKCLKYFKEPRLSEKSI